LESVCWGNSTVGSNPTLSAILCQSFEWVTIFLRQGRAPRLTRAVLMARRRSLLHARARAIDAPPAKEYHRTVVPFLSLRHGVAINF
jgi:hypothetical protein